MKRIIVPVNLQGFTYAPKAWGLKVRGRVVVIGVYRQWTLSYSRGIDYHHLDVGPLCVTWEAGK